MSSKRILVVDDEKELVEMIKIRLEAMGYEVFTAHDGQEGLDKAYSLNPGLIVLDVMMPKIDGLKVCQALKDNEKYRHIPIIMLSARTQAKDTELAGQAGADAYVTKPFESGVLIENIRKFIK